MESKLELACEHYRLYFRTIFDPATESILRILDSREVRLHEVYGANFFVAHAVDYIAAIRTADGTKEDRRDLVKRFDELFSVDGRRFQNKKFQLIDTINNALKHIQIEERRYHNLPKEYRNISFKCLTETEGQIFCLLDGYRFDYSRVVLRPAINALSGCKFEDLESVLDFARGGNCPQSPSDMADSDDPIDQMIDYANPSCQDCGEGEGKCKCGTYVYEGEAGTFDPISNEEFDFDNVMSRISGAYRREQ